MGGRAEKQGQQESSSDDLHAEVCVPKEGRIGRGSAGGGERSNPQRSSQIEALGTHRRQVDGRARPHARGVLALLQEAGCVRGGASKVSKFSNNETAQRQLWARRISHRCGPRETAGRPWRSGRCSSCLRTRASGVSQAQGGAGCCAGRRHSPVLPLPRPDMMPEKEETEGRFVSLCRRAPGLTRVLVGFTEPHRIHCR